MTVKNQLVFASIWTVVYTFAFNLIRASFSGTITLDLVLGAGWVFLLFLAVTYSSTFFFTVIPLTFVTSSMVAYGEWLIKAPVSRDVVASAFQSNWQEMLGLIGSDFVVWMCGAVLLSVLCIWHFVLANFKHPLPIKFTITTGFIVVYLLCAGKTRSIYGHELQELNVFHWQHPFDYFDYTINFIKKSIDISSHGNKYDVASLPVMRQNAKGEPPLQIVLIIGEAARADHFGLYGYKRNTTPRLQKEENIFLFTDVNSCGTTTMISVPCMMTRATQKSLEQSINETSFISLFKKLGFKTIWVSEQAKFDSVNTIISTIANESEKTVFQDNTPKLKLFEFKDYFINYIHNFTNENVAVYHMMGSHFPYFWMYPIEFSYFSPYCQDTNLLNCPLDSLINAYDNTIIFTDYFLTRVIDALKDKNAMMIYVSDHGEYLGEHGKFLHGQETEDAELRHVPMILWVSDIFIKYYPNKIRAIHSNLHDKISHDNLFHSVLHCAGVESAVVDKTLSICESN